MSSLPLSDVRDYDRVKQALITAFDVCADVFRKRFRTVAKTLTNLLQNLHLKLRKRLTGGCKNPLSVILSYYSS
jgi:hypothetical protein